MAAIQDVEKSLSEIFVDKAPALPLKAKQMIVTYLPWINLVLGVFALWAAWTLWEWAHTANRLADYVNSFSQLYGGDAVIPTSRLSVSVWLSIIVLAVEAVVYIMAFPALRARKKSGWNLLFYALLVNVVYGVVVLFTDYGSFGNLLGTVIGSAIGLYFLFQIRGEYLGIASKTTPAAAPKKAE